MKPLLAFLIGSLSLLSESTLQAAGRQLTGVYAPTPTPALPPDVAQKKFSVPPGFEVRLFAAEPDVVNPVAMTWDERGRLWVVELYEYPLGARAGSKPRDQIKILEDTDNDGRADKVTVFADGLNLATGLLLGYGGAFVGQAPHFLFLEDTDGDGVADKRTILKTGFGLDDRHEMLNGFAWGPDGWLYMTHGVFTRSRVRNENDPQDDGVTVTAAVARYHPRTKRFEVFAEGTSNPWGVDFDREGNAFVTACVIPHMFHMAPGGLYQRQAGTPAFPYAYELLPTIVDHTHFRAAYAGVQIYQGNQYPEEYKGTIFMGNIHDSAVHQDRLTPAGSTFRSSFVRDFVRANDGWFRPVSEQIGPDGALWIMDWYDKYPCYQNAQADPEGVDRTYGRIWRVVYVGEHAGAKVPSRPEAKMDLSNLSSQELVQLLQHPNAWQRRVAQRLLSERRDPATKPALEKLLASGPNLESRLAALWTLHGSELLSENLLDRYADDREQAIRSWTARLTGERRDRSDRALERLAKLAEDPQPPVRLAVASAVRQFVSGSLTVDTPIEGNLADLQTGPVLIKLIRKSAAEKDAVLAFMIWMAAEPQFSADPPPGLQWLAENGPELMPLSGVLTKKAMRRLCDMRDPRQIDSAVEFIGAVFTDAPALAVEALDGLLEGQRGKAMLPTTATGPFLAKLMSTKNPAVLDRAQRLGTLWGDRDAFRSLADKASAGPVDERVKSIRVLGESKSSAARDYLMPLLKPGEAEAVVIEALRALGEIGGDDLGYEMLKRWRQFTPAERQAAAETLASRRRWSIELLSAIEAKNVSATELPATVIRGFATSKEDFIRQRAQQAIGRFRETDKDKLRVIAEKRRVVLSGPIDIGAGHEIAKKTCFVCHKLYGEGAEVGPDLTGVGRSSLDALLANIIDPNQVIGKGYENVEIETKDGRTVSGRVIEETPAQVKIVSAGPKEEVVSRGDISSRRVTELSVMPEGLEQMPDADFRNLIWFLLNPPQDNRPMTPALRKQLVGEENKTSSAELRERDGESVALWNPEWRVIAPDFEGTPKKLPEFAGRNNVLVTHPFDRERGAVLERVLELPAGRPARLNFDVAADERGDWELRVLANEQLVKKEIVSHAGARWKEVQVDLSNFAGKKVVLRLENSANDWAWEFGYWHQITLHVD